VRHYHQPVDFAAVPAPAEDAQAAAQLRDRAVLATGISFTLADARSEDVRLSWVNPAFTATTGYSAEESVGRNCRFLQGPGTDRDTVTELRDALAAGRHATVTLLNYRKDGTPFWNQLAMSPVHDAAGTLTHFIGVQTDVTEQVEADRTVLHAEQAARADADTARAEAEQARAEADEARADAERAQAVAERALRSAEQSARRLSIVAEATGLLAATLDVDGSLDRLSRLVVPLLADWAVITLVDDDGLPPHCIARHHDGHQELLARYTALVTAARGSSGALPDPFHGSPTLVPSFQLPDRAALSTTQQEVLDLSRQLGVGSLLRVPLVARRRVLGTIMLVQGRSERVFDEDDLGLAADLGRHAGLAVDNARLYTQEHQMALTLQRALLPQLPQVPGLALAAEYLPAAGSSQVGGDWWDVFALPDGATAVTIGDVMGHDLAAAAAMGQLRSVLRTCAWAGDSPSKVLDSMDQLVQGFDMAQLATCVYARVQAADDSPGRRRTPRLRWANAGHLPPVLLTPDGLARLLPDAVSVPLGVPASERREHADLSLVAGSTLLLYTDGLVETRTGDIDSDLAGLLRAVSGHRPADGPQALVDRLTQGLDALTDDAAVLAIQVL